MRRLQGFLLIETLVALAAIAITLGAAADLMVLMVRTLQRIETARIETPRTEMRAREASQ